MNIEELRDFCLSMEGVAEKTPFGKFARRYDSILVFYVCDRMFCLTDMDDFTSVTVKLTPDEIEELRITRSSVGNPVFFIIREAGNGFRRVFTIFARL